MTASIPHLTTGQKFYNLILTQVRQGPKLPLSPEQLLACCVGNEIPQLSILLTSDRFEDRDCGCQMAAAILKEDSFGPTTTLKLLVALDYNSRNEYMSSKFEPSIQEILREDLPSEKLAHKLIFQLLQSCNSINITVAFALWKDYGKSNTHLTKALFHKCIENKCIDISLRIYQLHTEATPIELKDRIRILSRIGPQVEPTSDSRIRRLFYVCVGNLFEESAVGLGLSELLERKYQIEIESEDLAHAEQLLMKINPNKDKMSRLPSDAYARLCIKFLKRALATSELDDHRQVVRQSLELLASHLDQDIVKMYCTESSLRMRCGAFDSACNSWIDAHQEALDWLPLNDQISYAHRCCLNRKPVPASIELGNHLGEMANRTLSDYELNMVHDCIDLLNDKPDALFALARQTVKSHKARAQTYLLMAIRAKGEVSEASKDLTLSILQNKAFSLDELVQIYRWTGGIWSENPKWRLFLYPAVEARRSPQFLIEIILDQELLIHAKQDLPNSHQKFVESAFGLICKNPLSDDQLAQLNAQLKRLEGYTIPDALKLKMRPKCPPTVAKNPASQSASEVVEGAIPHLQQMKPDERNKLKAILKAKAALKKDNIRDLEKAIHLCLSTNDPLMLECAALYLKRMTEFYLDVEELNSKSNPKKLKLSQINSDALELFNRIYRVLTALDQQAQRTYHANAFFTLILLSRFYPSSDLDGLFMIDLFPYDQFKDKLILYDYIWLMSHGLNHYANDNPKPTEIVNIRARLSRYKSAILGVMNGLQEQDCTHHEAFLKICQSNLLTLVLEPSEFLPYYFRLVTILIASNNPKSINDAIQYLNELIPLARELSYLPELREMILKIIFLLKVFEQAKLEPLMQKAKELFFVLTPKDSLLMLQYRLILQLPYDLGKNEDVFFVLQQIVHSVSEYGALECSNYALKLIKQAHASRSFTPDQIVSLFIPLIDFPIKIHPLKADEVGLRFASSISENLPPIANQFEPQNRMLFWSLLITSTYKIDFTLDTTRMGFFTFILNQASPNFRNNERPTFLMFVEILASKVLQVPDITLPQIVPLLVCVQTVSSLNDLSIEEKHYTNQTIDRIRVQLARFLISRPEGARLLNILNSN